MMIYRASEYPFGSVAERLKLDEKSRTGLKWFCNLWKMSKMNKPLQKNELEFNTEKLGKGAPWINRW